MTTVKLPHWAIWFEVQTLDGQPVRHRVFYGGRGGAKSWTVAHKIIELMLKGPARVLCTREYQNSLRDSSRKLLEDIIRRLGHGPEGDGFFEFRENEIVGRNGSRISFLGLNGKDSAIKSLEGYTLAWVEEAATVTQSSIDALIPTIRREGSEIWWTYNPRFPTDPVDRMFRSTLRPPGSIVVEVNGRDNPWFPEVLKREMAYDRERDPQKYQHIWLGGYLERSEALVFKQWSVERFSAPEDARFRFGADWGFSVDPTVLVRCFVGRWRGEPGKSEVIADPKGNCLFVDYEAYKIGCAIDHTAALFAGNDTRDPPRWINPNGDDGIPGAARTKIIADSARPETIDHLRRQGFTIEPATKGQGSVEDGIKFLQGFDIVVHPRCGHTIDELGQYSWAVDRQTGDILPKLADTNNHVIDALRYALEGARRAGNEIFEFYSADRRASAAYPMSQGERELLEVFERQGRGRGWGSVPGPQSDLKYRRRW